jgi:hypothetical protein
VARLLPTSWARTSCELRSPGLASPSPGASTLYARFADWLNGFFQHHIWLRPGARCKHGFRDS